MTFAQGNRLRLALVPETTAGVAPTSPAFQIMRVTKPSGGVKKNTFTSEEMDGSRAGRKVLQTGVDIAPSYGFELSYGTFDDVLESAMQGAWATDILKDGATRKAFTGEEADLGGTSTFFRWHGLEVDEFSLSLASRKEITGDVKFFGQSPSTGSSALSGATYTAATTTDVLTAATAVGALSLSGLTTQPIVKSLDLTIKNGLSAREQLGSLYSLQPSAAPVEITVSMMLYLQSLEVYDAVMAHGSGALSFQLGTTSGSKYQIDIPVLRFVNPDRDRSNFKTDQMLKVEGQAEKDATLGATMKITRGVS